MRSCLKYRACWLALVGIVAVGCGNKNTVPVKGVVTLDGRPVEGAMVKFVPVAPKGHEASAMTDSSGSFSLGTLTERDGAWPGSYKVCVQKVFIDAADQGKVPDAPGEDPRKGPQDPR